MIVGVASGNYVAPADARDGRAHWNGAGWVRLAQWFGLWGEHHQVYGGTLRDAGTHLQIEAVLPGGETAIVNPEVVYLQRLMVDLAGAIRRARANGQVVVQDVDDWWWGFDARNCGWRPDPAALRLFADGLAAADVVTVTTPFLADRLSERLRRDAVVIPNHVDVARFAPVDHNVEQPTIGWAGGVEFRSGDLAQLKGVLSQLRDVAAFQHSGHDERFGWFADEVGLDRAEVATVGRALAEDYPALLDFQVGVVPLRSNPFNDAKSDLKGLEYAACGIPFVASPTGPYRQLALDWGDCVRVAARPADFVRHLRALADSDTRQAAAEQLRKQVLARDLHEGLHHYLDLFASVSR
ncbi:MAG TPA: glycosyltransferase [Ilumatobacter sp.]|nr:glycosyltransferase [Ilumatobacter sp.]